MAGPNAVSPEIAAAMGTGRGLIGQSIDTSKRGLESYGAQYGIQAPDFYQQLASRLEGARSDATRDMDTSLKEIELRKRLHDQRLALMWKQLELQRKQQRDGMYATALGAAGAIGGSAMNMGNAWRSAGAKKPAVAPGMVPSVDPNPYLNPYLGLFDRGTL